MTACARYAPIARVPWPRGSSAEVPQEEAAPRRTVTYICARGHSFGVTFAVGVEPPPTWDHTCGAPARLEGTPEGTEGSPPLSAYNAASHGRPRSRDEISPWAQLRKRRTEAEGAALLAERLAEVRRQRGAA